MMRTHIMVGGYDPHALYTSARYVLQRMCVCVCVFSVVVGAEKKRGHVRLPAQPSIDTRGAAPYIPPNSTCRVSNRAHGMVVA